MLVQLSPFQARVIGVLIEKEITTPDQYPLSLNALTLGCNQKSSRDPVMALSEHEVQNVLDELRDMNLLFEHQSSGSRVVKYKHRFCNTEFSSLQFSPQQLAIMCVLLLRGPQTPGELRTRTNRLALFNNVAEVEACLDSLLDVNGDKLIAELARQPGKRDVRFTHLLSTKQENLIVDVSAKTQRLSDENDSSLQAHAPPVGSVDRPLDNALDDALHRIAALETQLSQMTQQLSDMQESIDILSS